MIHEIEVLETIGQDTEGVIRFSRIVRVNGQELPEHQDDAVFTVSDVINYLGFHAGLGFDDDEDEDAN